MRLVRAYHGLTGNDDSLIEFEHDDDSTSDGDDYKNKMTESVDAPSNNVPSFQKSSASKDSAKIKGVKKMPPGLQGLVGTYLPVPFFFDFIDMH